MRYEIPIEDARGAVKPAALPDVLMGLLRARVIEAFELTDSTLVIHADTGLEAAFVVEQESASRRALGTMQVRDGRVRDVDSGATRSRDADLLRSHDAGQIHAEASAEYYSRAEAFTRTRRFRALSKRRRDIWRLHARGLSKYEIADELGVPSGAVARAILFLRPKAGLRRTARAIRRGP